MNITSKLSFIDCRPIFEALNEIIARNLYIRPINSPPGWICGAEGLPDSIKGTSIRSGLSVHLSWKCWVPFINEELILTWLSLALR